MGKKSQQERAALNKAMAEQTRRRQRRYHTFRAAGEAMLRARRPVQSRDRLAMYLTALIVAGVLLVRLI